MPTYDFDGTTNYEIGKLYDFDGTTDYQIGKVYDNDGTADYLIYNAQTPEQPYVLQLGLDAQNDVTGGWTVNKQGTSWYFAGYNEATQSIRLAQKNVSINRYAWVYTNNKVNVSGWNKLIMRVSTYKGYGDATKSNGWAYVCLSNSQNAPMTSEAVNDLFTGDVVKGAYYYSTDSSKTEHLVEIDVSDIDGEYYIEAGQRSATSAATFTCCIHDIYFAE